MKNKTTMTTLKELINRAVLSTPSIVSQHLLPKQQDDFVEYILKTSYIVKYKNTFGFYSGNEIGVALYGDIELEMPKFLIWDWSAGDIAEGVANRWRLVAIDTFEELEGLVQSSLPIDTSDSAIFVDGEVWTYTIDSACDGEFDWGQILSRGVTWHNADVYKVLYSTENGLKEKHFSNRKVMEQWMLQYISKLSEEELKQLDMSVYNIIDNAPMFFTVQGGTIYMSLGRKPMKEEEIENFSDYTFCKIEPRVVWVYSSTESTSCLSPLAE